MRLTSLRSKIFLLVGLTLLIVAVAVITVTQRNVNRTVVASEEHAVRNVLNLLVRDSEARWGALLSDKIITVRNGRNHLLQLGNTLHSVLDMLDDQVRLGELTTTEAENLAKDWINRLTIDKNRYAFVFNHDLIVIASGKRELLGTSLTNLKDFKGHDLAASAYEEARNTGESFAIYRWPTTSDDGKGELRYAYFSYFEPWDWIFAITDSARQISEQFDRRRTEMETAVSEALASLRLAESGFAFIVQDDGELISPLPAEHTRMLDERGMQSHSTLRNMLNGISVDGDIATFSFHSAHDQEIWEISAAHFKPLHWTIVAAVPRDDLTRPAELLRWRLGSIFLGVLGLSLLLAWAMSARITRPLQQLSEFARKLPEQDLSAATNIPQHIALLPHRQPDEVGRLASTFIYMDAQLREKISRLVLETSGRERMESELNIARDIQMGLLPVPLPQAVLHKVDLHAVMLPAKEVGGDLYDYFLLNNGKLCLVIGDVSDKGVPAALFMAVTRTLIRASAEDETDPALLMARVNNRLSENNPRLMFVTLIIAVLDLETGELVWANAGHPPLCLIQADGKVRTLAGRSGPACGVQEDLPYCPFSIVLQPGETVLGYTDGVTEALNPSGECFGEPRLYDVLGHRAPRNAAQTPDALVQLVRQFAQGADQSDDITIIAARKADT